MALFQSQLVTAASGSVGGLNFHRTTAGLSMRGKAHPTNPQTPAQNLVRGALRFLAAHWIDTLTVKLRDAWDHYAFNTLLPGPFGNLRNVGGFGMFIRGSLPRLYAGLKIPPAAPTVFDLDGLSPIAPLDARASTQTFRFNYDNFQAWTGEADSGLLIYAARPMNASVNHFNRSYLLTDILLGNPIIRPSTPHTAPVPFPIAVGQKLFYRIAITRLDGRYSTAQTLAQLVT